MKIFLINSFNHSKYVKNAHTLSEELETFGFHTITVYGGGSDFLCSQLTNNKWVISIPENLSDNNAFVGFERAFAAGHFRELCYRNAVYIYVHDTCRISRKNFVTTINSLPVVPGWVFAHTYGLYNIGICNQDFLLKRAKDFLNVKYIPKDQSIALEQGHKIQIDSNEINPLVYYSKKTIAKVTNSDMDKCDFMSLNTFQEGESKRFVSYIGALSLYKLVGSHISYFVPIWASAAHQVHDQKGYDIMCQNFSHLELRNNHATVGTLSPWIPLVPT